MPPDETLAPPLWGQDRCVPGVFPPTSKKCESSSPSTKKELIAQEKKKLIRRHNGWEANKNVRATQAAPNSASRKSTGIIMHPTPPFGQSGSLRGLKLVLSKWRCRVPPTGPHQGVNAIPLKGHTLGRELVQDYFEYSSRNVKVWYEGIKSKRF
jgi:hypothetical protein